MDSKKRKKMLSFEEAMQKLENVVQSLEQGNIPLDLLVEKYQEGLTYQKYCQDQLDRVAMTLKTFTDELNEPSNKSEALE